ncbi:hypothetical protein [Gracilibacillus phocaeensis]|uniref:hypothetical protein n=1 Tax=Gracilibacillus phocaeensis TaxID=2042304 RepID=UPI0010317F90|nr:hypothetical protein [Gracilibacillus phocaeensis]
MKHTIWIFLLLMLCACDNDQEDLMITKETDAMSNETVEQPPEQAEPIEEQHEIEFALDDEVIVLNTNNITILKSFLATTNDREQAVANMKLEKLMLEKLYLLSFNCQDEKCSFLLLDRKEPNRSLLLDDMVKLKEIIPSPEETQLFILFEHKNKDVWKVFQLEDWEMAPFQAEAELEDLRVIEANWQDEQNIHIQYHLITNSDPQETKLRMIE